MIDFKNVMKLNQELAQKAQKESEESPKEREEGQGASQEESEERVNIVFEVRGECVSILQSMSKAEICAVVIVECANILLSKGERKLLELALEITESKLEETPDE